VIMMSSLSKDKIAKKREREQVTKARIEARHVVNHALLQTSFHIFYGTIF
jgi:hypothetical protein